MPIYVIAPSASRGRRLPTPPAEAAAASEATTIMDKAITSSRGARQEEKVREQTGRITMYKLMVVDKRFTPTYGTARLKTKGEIRPLGPPKMA